MDALETNLFVGSLRNMAMVDLLDELDDLYRRLYLYQRTPDEILDHETKIGLIKLEILKYQKPEA